MLALDQTLEEFGGDPDRVYLAAYSYGASVGYEVVLRHRSRFAAFVPVAGLVVMPTQPGAYAARMPVSQALLAPMRTLPTWVFQGRNDGAIPVAGTRTVVDILKSLGAPVRYTEYPDADHVSAATRAFATPELYTWLWAQRRVP
jgi:predicted peptidase